MKTRIVSITIALTASEAKHLHQILLDLTYTDMPSWALKDYLGLPPKRGELAALRRILKMLEEE